MTTIEMSQKNLLLLVIMSLKVGKVENAIAILEDAVKQLEQQEG